MGAANPIITKYSDINAGSILAGGTAGTAVLNSPSGTRSITGGTELGDSLSVALGRLTLTGKPGDHWAIRSTSAIPFNLTRIGGGTPPVFVNPPMGRLGHSVTGK